MYKTILDIDVYLDEIYHVNGGQGEAMMLLFHGSCSGEYFQGEILPGGVDTQTQKNNQNRTMSARYMLRGQDHTGQPCQIFIENNGVVEKGKPMITHPGIYTDSSALRWMEQESFTGFVEGNGENRVRIRICQEE